MSRKQKPIGDGPVTRLEMLSISVAAPQNPQAHYKNLNITLYEVNSRGHSNELVVSGR